jgi:integrase
MTDLIAQTMATNARTYREGRPRRRRRPPEHARDRQRRRRVRGPLGIAVAPHDCRRTFAKLALKGGARLEQIQLSLGHASIRTTERYLGVEQDLTDAPCDRLGLRLS